MEFSRQEYWTGWPFPWDLPNPGVKPVSPALQADSNRLSHQGSLAILIILSLIIHEHSCLSIHLGFLFLSATFYSFQCTSLLPLWLNLYLGILFFWNIVNVINRTASLISFLVCLLLEYRNTTNMCVVPYNFAAFIY